MLGQFPPAYDQLDPAPHGQGWVRCLSTGHLHANCLLVTDAPSGGSGLLVDPGSDGGQILRMVEASGAEVQGILLTHGHFDHIGAVQELRGALGVPVFLAADDWDLYRRAGDFAPHLGELHFRQPTPPDAPILPGQTFAAGRLRLQARPLPGHSPGHMVFVSDGFALAGDTLLRGGAIAPTQSPPLPLPTELFPGGSRTLLTAGIERELLSLPPQTVIYPGHGAPTTVQAEYGSPLFRRLRRTRSAPDQERGG